MFGLFESDLKKARRLRGEYEDIRAMYYYKFDDFQKHNFTSVCLSTRDDFEDRTASFGDNKHRWKEYAEQLRSEVKALYWQNRKTPSTFSDVTEAGILGVGLFALFAEAKALQTPEAKVLLSDMTNFFDDMDAAR
jgi:hypothetical protein